MREEGRMATGEQIKDLIKAHYDGDSERFKTAALRIAASETRSGHTALGRDLVTLVESASKRGAAVLSLTNKDGLFDISMPSVGMRDLVVSDSLNAKIERMLREYWQRKKAEGKHTGVILNAVKFKIVLRMFAVVKRGKPYVNTKGYKG
jgi:capsid protein